MASLNDSTSESLYAGNISGLHAGKMEALNQAVMDAQEHLGRLLLQAPPSPETAGMITLLIKKVLDLRAELSAVSEPAHDPGDPPRFDDI